MSATTPCVPCCSTPLTTNIPGPAGATGAAGADGCNAVSVVQATVAIEASPANTVFTVDSNCWFTYGQIVVVGKDGIGHAHFQVVSTTGDTTVTLLYLGYLGDVAAGVSFTAGATISPAGVQGELQHPLSVYASGAAAVVLTATDIQLAFSITKPDLVLTAPGTYVIFGRGHFKYDGAEWAANAVLTTKLKRTNNTAADLVSSAFMLPIIAHPGPINDAFEVNLPPIIYHTANSDDNISLRAILSAIPDAHDFSIAEASIVAIRVNSTTA